MRKRLLLLALVTWTVAVSGAGPCPLRELYRKRTAPFDDRYPMDAEANFSYDGSFAHLLGSSFPEWLAARKRSGKSTHVADFFGSGVFLRDKLQEVDSVTGVRLASKVVPGLVPGYPDPKWEEVTGNLFRREAWSGVSLNMRDRNIPAYDLVVSRPIGAVNLPKADAASPGKRRAFLTAHYDLVNRAWELLSKDDGVMLLEIPYVAVDTAEFRAWLKALEREGIEHRFSEREILTNAERVRPEAIEWSSAAILIRRGPRSPDRLPPF